MMRNQINYATCTFYINFGYFRFNFDNESPINFYSIIYIRFKISVG